MKLKDVLVKMYEGHCERLPDETDEAYLTRCGNNMFNQQNMQNANLWGGLNDQGFNATSNYANALGGMGDSMANAALGLGNANANRAMVTRNTINNAANTGAQIYSAFNGGG